MAENFSHPVSQREYDAAKADEKIRETMMWQVQRLRDGEKIVTTALSQTITLMFIRPPGAAVHFNITSDEAEPRLFDKNRFPGFTIDGEYISSFDALFRNKDHFLETLHKVLCFVDDRSLGAVIWSGDQITTDATIFKMMRGSSLHVRLFFHPFDTAEYNLSLAGLADALNQAFGVSTTVDQGSGSNNKENSESAPEVTVDRTAIRSMVEDHWRGFIPVSATGNMEVTAQCIKNFEDRIRNTEALMEPNKGKIFT